MGSLLVAELAFADHPSPRHPRSANQATPAAPATAGFVGDQACTQCHQTIANSYRHTAHHLTSQLATSQSILGSFAAGHDTLQVAPPGAAGNSLRFVMQAKQDGFYQTAIIEQATRALSRSQRFDIVIGSGVRGQSFLYWSSNQLWELPVSYWTDGRQWINSPGYRDGTANFNRPITPRCMECHVTFIQALSQDPHTNTYDQASLIPGIACESCHGPGAAHVAQAQVRPKTLAHWTQTIINPAKLDRDQQIDQCALCHNGTQRQELTAAFQYTPGKPLDQFLGPNPLDQADHPDVHGNQVGLLERSMCFRNSPSMTCSTCHNEHAPEQAAASYSARCLSCHQWQSCGASRKLGIAITHDCISCHMPVEQTRAIVSTNNGNVLHTSMRNHWIKIYADTSSNDPPPPHE